MNNVCMCVCVCVCVCLCECVLVCVCAVCVYKCECVRGVGGCTVCVRQPILNTLLRLSYSKRMRVT